MNEALQPAIGTVLLTYASLDWTTSLDVQRVPL